MLPHGPANQNAMRIILPQKSTPICRDRVIGPAFMSTTPNGVPNDRRLCQELDAFTRVRGRATTTRAASTVPRSSVLRNTPCQSRRHERFRDCGQPIVRTSIREKAVRNAVIEALWRFNLAKGSLAFLRRRGAPVSFAVFRARTAHVISFRPIRGRSRHQLSEPFAPFGRAGRLWFFGQECHGELSTLTICGLRRCHLAS